MNAIVKLDDKTIKEVSQHYDSFLTYIIESGMEGPDEAADLKAFDQLNIRLEIEQKLSRKENV